MNRNLNLNIFDIKSIEYNGNKGYSINEIKKNSNQSSIRNLSINDVQIFGKEIKPLKINQAKNILQKNNSTESTTSGEVLQQEITGKNIKFDKTNNLDQHICTHVKYSGYSNHLGNHHQAKYTLSKQRLKPSRYRYFDHKYHHKNHVPVRIQGSENSSNIFLTNPINKLSNHSVQGKNKISKKKFTENSVSLIDEKCCIIL
jgi:hypothetical protein